MGPLAGYVRSLDPQLPRPVRTLQLGALVNAFGNGVAYPFLFIYLHNVLGFSLGTTGLVVATNAGIGLLAGPVAGALIDRIGGRRMLIAALVLSGLGYASYPLVQEPWQAFLASAVAGTGNGAFWPSQSTLIASLTPQPQRAVAFAVQRVMMNLGIGLGGLTGGLIAVTSDPTTFTVLFLLDGATFLAYIAALAFVPDPERGPDEDRRQGRYADVLRHRIFVAVLALNVVFIAAGMAQLETFPVYAKNEADVTELAIGVIFFVNTVVIVLAQLPVARLLEGRRRMRTLALLGAVWAVSWLLVPVFGTLFAGAAAAAAFAFAAALFAVGECLHGTVHAPLVSDLADHRLLGRYMAMSAFSWQVGFTVGPAAGGFLLELSPNALWVVAACGCALAGGGALLLERAIPRGIERTPVTRRAEAPSLVAAEP